MRSRLFVALVVAATATFGTWKPLQAQGIQGTGSGSQSVEASDAVEKAALTAAAAGVGIPIDTFTFTSTKDNVTYSPKVLGQSPYAPPANLGSTSVNVVIVPLVITIGSTTFDPTVASSCIVGNGGTNLSPLDALTQSPLFQNVVWDGSNAAGHGPLLNGVNVGTTTYIDAFRRAEFWQLVGGTPYQTVFNVSTGPKVTIDDATVTNNLGGGTVSNTGCDIHGQITNGSSLQDYIKNTVIPSSAIAAIDPTALLYFLTVDVNGGGYNGYHSRATLPGSTGYRVFLFAQYNTSPINSNGSNRPGIVTGTHELGETMDNPLIQNSAPKWSQKPTTDATSCTASWEVGDPLSGTNLAPIVMPNGVTYYVQELAFFDWYYAGGSTNSQGAGGLFSSGGSFQGPSHACPPGGIFTSQTITFQPIPDTVYGTAQTLPLTATASSGLTVSFASTTPATCSVPYGNGARVSVFAAGSCSVQATQSGDSTYAAAIPVTRTFTISKATQTISFGALPGKTYGDPPFTVSASATSGLPVAFASSTPAICTVSGFTVTLLKGGTCTIQASQSGDSNYLAAAPVLQSLTVAKAAQTINFAPLANRPWNDGPFTLTATASSGLAVSYLSTTLVTCVVSGSTLEMIGPGTCIITASQAGNGSYSPATPVLQGFTALRAIQTITFGALGNKVFGDAPFTITATASSGLKVAFASNTTAVCTVSASTVTLLKSGTCTVAASQPGNSRYGAASPVLQSFTVAKAAQSISFAPLPNRQLSAGPFTVSATATSNLAVTFSSKTATVCSVSDSTVSLLTTGTCTIKASQAGSSQYLVAPNVNQSFTVLAPK